MVEEAEPHLFGGEESSEWLDRLERDHDNLRAALDHLKASRETQSALRLAGAVWVFWRDRAGFAEGRRRLEEALAADESPTAARAKALNAAASMASLGGEAATGKLRAEEALALHRILGDVRGAAESEMWLGWAIAMADDWATARRHFEEGVGLSSEVGDQPTIVIVTHFLAMAYAELGDRERARTLDEDNLDRIRELHNEQMEATTLDTLAGYAIDDGRVEEAVPLATESLRIYHDLGDPHGVAIELCRCAYAFALKGEVETAARLLSSSEAQRAAEIGGTMPWVERIKEQALTTIRAQLDEAVLAEAWEQGQALTAQEAVAVALTGLR
jgi:tetratricopeptide (TPR) repeat protein